MKKVTVYALSTCPWCHKTKNFLKEHNIPFDCIDYDLASGEDQKKVKDTMRNRAKNMAFPFIIIDDVCIQGYKPDEMKKCLGIQE